MFTYAETEHQRVNELVTVSELVFILPTQTKPTTRDSHYHDEYEIEQPYAAHDDP
jgi:hypothetical protein